MRTADRRPRPQLPRTPADSRRKKQLAIATSSWPATPTLHAIVNNGPGRRRCRWCGVRHLVLRGATGISAYGGWVGFAGRSEQRQWRWRGWNHHHAARNMTCGHRGASHVFYPSARHARGVPFDRKRLLPPTRPGDDLGGRSAADRPHEKVNAYISNVHDEDVGAPFGLRHTYAACRRRR